MLCAHVLEYETGHGFEALGSAGVEVFFALSGFLITAQLLEDHDAGRWSLRRFYERRARRLLPALAVLLVVLVALSSVMATPLVTTVWPVVGYVANWWVIAGHGLGALSPTWSLAVEEQFYLVWPVLLLVALRWRRGPVVLASSVIAVSIALRFGLASTDRVYAGSDTQAASLVVGALLAIAATRGLRQLRVAAWLPGAAAVGLFSAAALGSWGYARLVPTVVPLVAVVLIWVLCSTSGTALEWSWLRYAGRRSYAVYLWHTPLLWLAALAVGRGVVSALLGMGLTIGAAELSWRLVEKRWLRNARHPVEELVGDDSGRAGRPVGAQ